MNLLIETNAWQANDHGNCRNECSNRREPIDRNGLCEYCYYNCEAQLCCDPKCMNIRHVAGEDGCSLHELEWAKESGDGAQIALWTAYHSLDETLTHPQLRRLA